MNRIEFGQQNTSGKVVIVSPHSDDAAFSAWHALAVAETVLTVCTKIPSEEISTVSDAIAGYKSSRALMIERRSEDEKALAAYNINVLRLEMPDYQYSGMAMDPAAICGLLEERLGQAKILYAPAGMGGHPDHVAVRQASILLRNRFTIRLYADLPYAVHYGWPYWVDKSEQVPYLDVDADWDRWLEPIRTVIKDTTVVDLGMAWKEKLGTMKQYASQWPSMNNGSIRRLEREEISRYEVFFELKSE